MEDLQGENLVSDNRTAILEILDGLRRQAEADELLQIFVVSENGAGFEATWSSSEDKFGIAGFVMGSAMSRMGFARHPDPES